MFCKPFTFSTLCRRCHPRISNHHQQQQMSSTSSSTSSSSTLTSSSTTKHHHYELEASWPLACQLPRNLLGFMTLRFHKDRG